MARREGPKPPQPVMQEQEPIFPVNFDALLKATIGDSGALRTLWKRVEHIPDAYRRDLLPLIDACEDRVRRFLVQSKEEDTKKKPEPSPYASLLLRGISGNAQMSTEEKAALEELSFHVISELQPIIRHIFQILETASEKLSRFKSLKAIGTPEGFMSLLSRGTVYKQSTYSLFGILNRFAAENKDFPRFNFSESKERVELAVEDPFAADLDAYWKKKQDTHRAIYGEKRSIPQFCAQSTRSASYELYDRFLRLDKATAAAQEELRSVTDDTLRKNITGNIEVLEKNREACYKTALWLSKEAEIVDAVPEDSFHHHLAGRALHYGISKDTMELLNHLETLKQYDSDLYVRLLGIQAVPISASDTRSDLYGNMLQVTVHHSRYTKFESKDPGWLLLRERIAALTNLSREETPLVSVSDHQWKRLQGTARRLAKGGAEQLPQSLVALKRITDIGHSYFIRKFLEGTEFETREQVLAQLRVAPPRDFIRLVQEHFKGKDKEPPADLVQIFQERQLLDFYLAGFKSGVAGWVQPSPRNVYGWIEEMPWPFQDRGQGRLPWIPIGLEFCLRRSTPSEQLLRGNDFFGFLGYMASGKQEEKITVPGALLQLRKSGEAVFTPQYYEHEEMVEEFRPTERRNIEAVLAILDAHPDITKKQWDKWLVDLTWYRGSPSFAPEGDNLDQKKIDPILPFLRSISPQDVYASRSNFFVNMSFVDRSADIAWFYNHDGVGRLLFERIFGISDDSPPEEQVKREEFLKDPIKKFVLLFKLCQTETFVKSLWPRIARECNVTEFCKQLSQDVSPEAEYEFLCTLMGSIHKANAEAHVPGKRDEHIQAPLRGIPLRSLLRFFKRVETVEPKLFYVTEFIYAMPDDKSNVRLRRAQHKSKVEWVPEYWDAELEMYMPMPPDDPLLKDPIQPDQENPRPATL